MEKVQQVHKRTEADNDARTVIHCWNELGMPGNLGGNAGNVTETE